MALKFIILDSAKEEFKDIKKYVKKDFGDVGWKEVNSEYKTAFASIKHHPQSGSPIEQLREMGLTQMRYKLVRQTRVVYEFENDLILIHMFIHTKRDFMTHLMKRMLS